jgi:hypothetical protein
MIKLNLTDHEKEILELFLEESLDHRELFLGMNEDGYEDFDNNYHQGINTIYYKLKNTKKEI